MGATTTPSTQSLINQIHIDYPELVVAEGDDFLWSPSKRMVEYNPNDAHWQARLLHEIAHATLHHMSYESDIELIQLERDAWHHASTVLAPKYSLIVVQDIIEDDLDSYRDWIHTRSLCPHCQQNGVQSGELEYTCLVCRAVWRVNTATACALRRYLQK